MRGLCDGRPYSHKPRDRSENKIQDTVSIDITRPIEKPGLDGERFLLVMAHRKTGATMVWPLKTKGKQDKIILNTLEWLKNLGHPVVRVQCDNAAENVSAALVERYGEMGIMLKTSNPYESNQNAAVERRIRLVMERERALDSGLPSGYWPYSARTAAHVLNLVPDREGITPIEKLLGEKPKYETLRVFGCLAYIIKPKIKRTKLGKRASKAIMVGYTDNGYVLRDFQGKEVFSRNVDFDEKKKEWFELKGTKSHKNSGMEGSDQIRGRLEILRKWAITAVSHKIWQ
jgi:hypothetical protein